MFFRNLTTVGVDMQLALKEVFSDECYSSITTLQISNADLPTRYENALTATNLAI